MLKIHWIVDEPAVTAGQLLAVPFEADSDPQDLHARFGASVMAAMDAAPFSGKPGEMFVFTREASGVLQHVAIVGAGEGLDGPAALRQFAHDAVRQGTAVGATNVIIDLSDQAVTSGSDALPAQHVGNLLAQGAALGTYAYDRFLSESKRKPQTVEAVHIRASETAGGEGITSGQIYADAIARARDLTNGPPDLVTPSHLATTAREIVDATKAEHDVSLKILERDECHALGMGCYLAVAQGSDEPPKFIHLTYKPKGASKGRICLVGKGVTFDSGGYSLKPSDGMLDMKMDMAGAAAVLGAFEGAVHLGVDYEVHAIVAATENMVNGRAYRLGDVITASNGKTVEINNTDAEGRLTLADALVYAGKLEPMLIIDFATLTGACLVALGPKIAGVMTRDEALYADWSAAATSSSEEMWRLPLPEDLKEQLKSKIADMKNTGERWGGALTAGLFLTEFTEGQRWMHVDIAGPAMAAKPYGITTPGGTGFPVATILEFLAGDRSA